MAPAPTAKTTPDVRDRDEHPGEERPDQGSEAFDRRRGTVRADQLLRIPCERGKQRLQGGPDERHGEPDDGRERKDRRQVLACEEGDCRPGERRRTDKRDHGEEAFAPEMVAERGREGRHERGGQQADQPGDPYRSRPARVVREDAERDEVRPLGRDRCPPSELEAPDVSVAKNGNEPGERVTDSSYPHPAIESQKPATNKTTG